MLWKSIATVYGVHQTQMRLIFLICEVGQQTDSEAINSEQETTELLQKKTTFLITPFLISAINEETK